MANLQLEAFGELFNSETAIKRFKDNNYSCPFDSRISMCNKPNRGALRYGSCTAQYGANKRIICPRRFYENNYRVLRDVKKFIWDNGDQIESYDEFGIIATSEDDKFHYGNLDWLLVNPGNNNDFCGIEVQSDATTGTGAFKKAISDLLVGDVKDTYNFGLNTLASFKGFLPQFIFKGQLFDDWKRPFCAIMQDELWVEFIKKFRIRFKPIDRHTSETFLFFIYSLVLENGRYVLSEPTVYATRWIDLLFSFSVRSELLISLDEISDKIKRRTEKGEPFIRMS